MELFLGVVKVTLVVRVVLVCGGEPWDCLVKLEVDEVWENELVEESLSFPRSVKSPLVPTPEPVVVVPLQ